VVRLILQTLFPITVALFPLHSTDSYVKTDEPNCWMKILYAVIGEPLVTGIDQWIVTLSSALTVLTVKGDSGLYAQSKMTLFEKLL